jgi:hypothetical protein
VSGPGQAMLPRTPQKRTERFPALTIMLPAASSVSLVHDLVIVALL